VWAPTPRRDWHDTGQHQADYYERVVRSLSNVIEAWKCLNDPSTDPDYWVPVPQEEYNERYIEGRNKVRRMEREAIKSGYYLSGARGAPTPIEEGTEDLWEVEYRCQPNVSVVPSSLLHREHGELTLADIEAKIESWWEEMEATFVADVSADQQTLGEFA